ncbi:Sec7-like domain belongs to guanine nucleotide exchange factors [Mycena indigotica]|uniref:Glutathione hydrolase n=1 Tax=Mycena indigotica TaxID=2126181 RepID=A0A8H6TBZ4_9AGAR|nr:Sec7-like domain belongs to guanine nucleotide exchange factors [Mycena indigotica]KAF7315733.1 Sec7-like domain belongs to guanine nucleotide exchange factors [Mycena indigotica]
MGKLGLPVYVAPPSPRRKRSLIPALCLCLLTLLCYHYTLSSSQPRHGVTGRPAYLIKARNGAVASENSLCSQIGVEVLKAGGNAVDAAIATTFCVGTVSMYSSGIGGGGWMTVRIPPAAGQPKNASEVFTIDFRETAPLLANRTMFPPNSNTSQFGGLSVGVPGEIRGLEEAHRRWGTLPWKTLLEPSIRLARGWTVQEELADRITWFPTLMLGNPDWSAIFAPGGKFLRKGDAIQRRNYSRTLATIASEGPDAFYKGPIADSLVKKVHATGGILSHSDLANYRVKVTHALQGTYRGRKIYTSHAPASGLVLLHMLNLMETYPPAPRTPLSMHRVLEILKYGFAARTKMGDPAFDNNVTRMDVIPTKEFAELVAANITDDRTHAPSWYNPEYEVKIDHGTSHTSVVDKNDMAVSLTSTVNLIFGSQVLDPETGVILNDEMDDFSVPGTPNGFGLYPSPYNYPAPGKRPLSSTAPTIIENQDGSFAAAIGGSGGSRIFGAVFQTILNLEWGLDASRAVEFWRLHNQLYPLETDVDAGFPADLVAGLLLRGHNLTDTGPVAAVVQVVVRHSDGEIQAASDSRKRGLLTLATSCLYFGSFSSLPTKNPDGTRHDDVPERLSGEDALYFPIIGSLVLVGLFFVVKYLGAEWINILLGVYFSVAGVAAVWKALIGVARWAVGEAKWKENPEFALTARVGNTVLVDVSMASISLWLLPVAVIPSAVYMFNGRSALLTDVLGVAFASSAISLLKIDSFRTGTILLSGLFLYDIYWVFFSKSVFGTSVMVKVATSVDVPIKLLWPKSVKFGIDRGFTMLGLGDIVVPGVFVALALRYDHFRAGAPTHTQFGRPYFHATLAAYILGLLTTMAVMHVFQSPQPALLYLSPACIGAFFVVSASRGQLKTAWAWNDDDEEDAAKLKAE